MTLFLHIGMQKTGTTSLQISMAAARPALAQAGLLYPSGTLGLDLPETNAHHYLAHAMQDRRYRHTPAADFAQVTAHCALIVQAAAAFEGDTVLSSEDFSRLPLVDIVKLRPHLPDDTKIVIYLRRQDHWIDSLYGQAMKFGTAPELSVFIRNQRRRLNYQRFLEDWSSVFGVGNIIVRAYERDVRQDLCSDFCQAIQRPAARNALPEVRRDNASLTSWQIALLDDVPEMETRRRLRRLFEQHNCQQDQPDRLHHLPVDMARSLLAKHAAHNRAVAQTFLQRDTLFADQSPPRQAEMAPEDLDGIRNLVARLGTAPQEGAADPWAAIDAALHRMNEQTAAA